MRSAAFHLGSSRAIVSIWLAAAFCLHAQVILDRVAIVVGLRVVKTSDIERDLRASEFLNHQPVDVSNGAKRKIAERMIEQTLIRQEMQTGNWAQPGPADVDGFVNQLKKQRFGGSDAEFSKGLAQYGLTLDQFRKYADWQLTVLRFIDERFRPGVLVTEGDIPDYYELHREEFGGATLEEVTPKIREQLTGEKINQAFEEWLKQVRSRARVQFKPEAFGGEAPSAEGNVEP